MAAKKRQRGQSIKSLARYVSVCKAWRFLIWSPQFIQKKINHGSERMARRKRKREQSIMPELPHDIIIHILLRLPVKSLVRFKRVCKAWHTLITSEQFIRKHLNHAMEDNYNNRHCVLLSSYCCRIQCLHYGELEGNTVQQDFLLNYWKKKLKVVGSFHGLLCVVLDKSAIVVCNPSTREHKRLPVISSVGGRPSTEYLIGFGYDLSIDDYKVVRVGCKYGKILMENPAEIYTLKTNSWKEIQGIPYDVCLYWGREGGTPVNGALYWQVIRPINSMDNFNNGALLRFDLMNEKFMVVPLPRDVAEEPMSSVGFPILSLGVFGGSLCIVQDHHETAVVIWALKEDDSSMDFFWSKLMTIPRMDGMQSNRFLAPICFTKNGEVLMNVRQKSPSGLVSTENEFYLYNPAEEKVTFKELLFRNIWFDYWNRETGYLQSLISHSGWNGDTGYIDDTGYIECLISRNGVGYWNRETGYIESLISPNGVGTHRSRKEENAVGISQPPPKLIL